MDLARNILKMAKKMEKEEKASNYITFDIYANILQPRQIIKKSFKIYPCNVDIKVTIEFNDRQWTLHKKSSELERLLLTILRQCLRDIVVVDTTENLINQMLYFDIFYRNKAIFKDHYMVIDDITSMDLSCNSLYECNDNEEIKCIHRLFLNYVDICLNMDMES